ncbi:MAG TPA: PfkB family carbohydrate kinase, partial [Actinomycetaceae bacterium]|nr:PfkB family carbohydrate kinase [Actinomycetaceae bacterium]
MLVVCPNPTRDHQVHLPSLLPGTVSRATRQGSLAGGKPINVARALRSLGARPTLLILLPNHESDGFHASLAAEGLDAQYVRYDGALRTSIILFEENGRVTVVNGPGSPVPTPSWQEFAETAAAAVAATPAGESRWAACSGSLPPGVS